MKRSTKQLLTLLTLIVCLLASWTLWRVQCGVKASAKSVALACPSGNVFYVDANVVGGLGDGTSWTDAYRSLATALAQVPNCSNVTEIWVARGTYKPTTGTARGAAFRLRNNLAIYGGFSSGQTELSQRNPDPATNGTVLSGNINLLNTADDNSYHVVISSGTDNTAKLDGFTISDGNANHSNSPDHDGGGIYNEGGNPTIANVILSSNSAKNGGGMYNKTGSSPSLTNVTFSNNSAFSIGGGLSNLNSTPTLTNVSFSNNSASVSGGGMYNSTSNPQLTNVRFSGNSTAANGGGIRNNNSDPILTNVTFSGNSASDQGGGIYNGEGSTPTLTNVSFSGNSAPSGQGGGIYNSTSNPRIRNSILWGDIGGEIVNATSTPTVTYSIVQGGYTSTGNRDLDPLFVTPVPAPAPTTKSPR